MLDDLQERCNPFMNKFTERTWYLPVINDQVKELIKTHVQHLPRNLRSEVDAGPITIIQSQRFQYIREALEKEGVGIGLPTGN